MFTKKQFWIASTTLLLAASSAMANEQWVDEIVETQKSTGELKRSADCLGVNKNEYETVLRHILETCIEETGFTEHSEQCMREQEKAGRKKLGITEADIARCEDDEEEDEDYYEDEDWESEEVR